MQIRLTILQEGLEDVSREMFWPGRDLYGSEIGFLIYISAAIAVLIVLVGIYRSMRVWFQGKYDHENQTFFSFFLSLIIKAIKNVFSSSFFSRLKYGTGGGITKRKTMPRASYIVHLMMLIGFLGAAIATIISTIHEYLFHEALLVGPIYLIYSFGADLAGLLLFIGTVLAFVRRYLREPSYFTLKSIEDGYLLALLFWVSVSGFFMEATRILHGFVMAYDVSYEIFSFISYPLALLLHSIFSLTQPQIFALHFFFYISHLLVAFLGAAYLTLGKFFHVGVGLANVVLSDLEKPRGKVKFNSEGISKIEDFTFYQLFEASACMKCHVCESYCPAYDTNEPLSPMKVIQDVKNWGRKQYGLFKSSKNISFLGEDQLESGLTEDVLWACITCYACVNACPVLIQHVDQIVGMRAAMIEEGTIPGTYTTVLESVYNYGNIWNQPKRDRINWVKEGNLPNINESKTKLLWLPGDTLAYDPRNQKVARATYNIFSSINLDFGTFGDAEKNDGNEMRRLGEEALFQMLAEENIQMFKKRNVSRIICSSPHAFNTIKNEYPDFGGKFDVLHITQFLLELIEAGKIKLTKKLNYEVTYHDPCYLGRYNGEYDAPRKLISLLPGVKMKEMQNNKQFSYCCGGGGGGMFRETPKHVKTRISERRVLEAQKTFDLFDSQRSEIEKPQKILITACPFCTSMLVDATKTQQLEESIEVKDIVELINEAMEK